jgi:integrase
MFRGHVQDARLGHLREQHKPIVFRDLRHMFGTVAVQVWPVTDVQAYMGHARHRNDDAVRAPSAE